MENGGNNPPMPEVMGEVATGSTYSSTASTGLDVPAIAGRPAATIEGPRHANVSTDDPLAYLKKQHITLRSFTWSTSQLPGTLLVSIPITPLRANINVSYLAGMYNAWNGGLEYQVKIAGTGFHAGSLGIARIPPNLDPTTFKTKEEFTVFEYNVIDPKTLEAISKHVPDQRPIMYHYMSSDLTDPNNIGGHFCIFIIQQLNTSSTGTNQIDVEIFNKLAPDFRFIQMKPPTLSNAPIADVSKWTSLFSTPSAHLHTIYPLPINTMTFNASTFSSAAKPGLRNLSGQLFQDDTYISDSDIGNLALLGFPFFATSATSLIPVKNSATQFNKNIVVTQNSTGFTPVNSSGSILAASPINFNAANAVAGAAPGAYYNHVPNLGVAMTVAYPGIAPSSAPAGESLVTFAWQDSGVARPSVLTTTFLSAAFATGQFQISPNEAVLGVLFSKSTGLAIANIKIYYSGIITTNAQVTSLDIDFYDINFRFVSIVQASSPIVALSFVMQQSLQTIRLVSLLNRTRQLHLGD